jgi:hypothetical protein
VRMEGLEPSPLRTRPSNVRVYRFRHIRMPVLYRVGPVLSIGEEVGRDLSRQRNRREATPELPDRYLGLRADPAARRRPAWAECAPGECGRDETRQIRDS